MMKVKYEKMIDEYVKKHYGDLERGVLAPEVKYKVLFKLYRKKYKKEKEQVKVLRRLLKDKEELESWAPPSNKVLPKEDGLKKFPDLHEVCENCAHFREGKGKDKSICAKHDKFVPKSGSCYEFEDKPDEEDAKRVRSCHKCRHSIFKPLTDYMGAATGVLWCEKNENRCDLLGYICDEFENGEDSYQDWLHDDITWCCRECSNMDCERNNRNRRCKEGLFSAADMFDPFKCPVDAEMPKNNP